MTSPFRPWRVAHVDLADDAPGPLEARSGEGGLFVSFWWRDLPLGGREVSAEQLPIPGPAVRSWGADAVAEAVADRLFEHGFRPPPPELSPPPDPPPALGDLLAVEAPLRAAYARVEAAERAALPLSMSVVVCTRDRPEALRRCLAALAALDPAPDEVVVVDNAPADGATRRVVEAAPGAVRYVAEPEPGLSAARNAGLRAATGDVVAYTDDDVEVHPRWALRLRSAFDAPGVWAVTGLVLPAELETGAQLLFERNHGGFGWGYRAQTFDAEFFGRMRRHAVPVWQLGAGANMAFRREAFEAVGGFDERLGAGASGCSEDSEMWYRVLAGGGQCRYEPSAVVFHTHRRDDAGLRSQMHAYLRGHVAALLLQHEQHGDRGSLRRAVATLPGYYGRWAVRRALGRPGGPAYLGAQVRGWAAGFGYYLRHRRRPGAPDLPDPS